MALPTVTGTPTSNKGGGSLTITLDAGLSIVAICTQAEDLTTSGGTISNASSGWTAIVGTKGGSGFTDGGATGIALYVFYKVTTAGETISTGDSGVFQVYQALTVTGYKASGPIEAVNTRTKNVQFSGDYVVGDISNAESADNTAGPDRLIIGFGAPNKDTNTAFAGTFSSGTLSSVTTLTAQETALGTGGGLVGFYGGFTGTGDWGTATATDGTYGLTGTLQATLAIVPANVTVTGAASLSGTGTLSASGTRKTFGAISLTGTGSLSASGVRKVLGAAALAGTGSLAASGIRSAVTSASLTGTGTLTAAGEVTSGGLLVAWPQRTDSAWAGSTGDPWTQNSDDAWEQH